MILAKTCLIIIILLAFMQSGLCQVPQSKEYSKEVALYKAKEFLMTQVLKISDKPVRFEMEALTAANSGELTALAYSCDELNKDGLIFGFFGSRVAESGLSFTSYAFKHFAREDALIILKKIEKIRDENKSYLQKHQDNNVFFKHNDVTFLIYDLGSRIRVFWEGFDSEWEASAFKRTVKRF